MRWQCDTMLTYVHAQGLRFRTNGTASTPSREIGGWCCTVYTSHGCRGLALPATKAKQGCSLLCHMPGCRTLCAQHPTIVRLLFFVPYLHARHPDQSDILCSVVHAAVGMSNCQPGDKDLTVMDFRALPGVYLCGLAAYAHKPGALPGE